jgi:ribosomal protein S18 acetylase RimI-like enzyme
MQHWSFGGGGVSAIEQVMKVQVREATARDLPAVLALYAQPGMDNGWTLPLGDALSTFERFSRYPDYRLCVACVGQEIVGTFALLVMDNLGHCGAPSGVLEDVAVAPHWQRRGIGRTMIRQAIETCRAKGCYKLALSSNVRRGPAHAFYESLGFSRHGYSFTVEL